MATIPQSVFFPHLKRKYHVTPPPRHQEDNHLIPIDSPASSATVVYIVCNDAAQVSSLTKFLSSQSISVRAFRTATDYISNAGSDRTACVILDLNLPDIGGLEVQSRLVEVEGPPVIFVAAHSDLNSGVRAIKNGAIDFMIEPIDYNRLLSAVLTAFAQDRISRRERVERSSLLKRWVALTPREQNVFRFTVAGFLNKQAAAELGITENTFQVHRGRVMRKMEADSLANLVRMSTRLETLVQSQSQRQNHSPSQQPTIVLNGQAEENRRGRSALALTYLSRLNRLQLLRSNEMENCALRGVVRNAEALEHNPAEAWQGPTQPSRTDAS